MSRIIAVILVLSAVAAAAAGCKGDAPSLSVAAGALSADSVAGSWDGAFIFNDDAPLDQFEETVISVCKSMRIHIDFHQDGKMNMRATMLFPEVGEQTSDSNGSWEFVSAKDQSVVIRSTEKGGEPEEATLHFNGADQFEMQAPDNLKELGVMRFTRQ